MREVRIDELRHTARKLIRELGMLEVDPKNSQKTPGDWHALLEVAKHPGITISELGRLLLMSISTISRLVKSLDKNGFLILKEGNDKREKSLFLTDIGEGEVRKINEFSDSKIRGAFEFLSDEEIHQIINAIAKYGEALEKGRVMREEIKIVTLSTSRTIRKQIVNMISDIQENEFLIPITKETNSGILKAEEEFYYNNSYNFWYAVNKEGKILGSIGLKKNSDHYGEIKKLFVIKDYRGKGVAQKLMNTLLKAASKHKFDFLILGTIDKLLAAHKFYSKCGFTLISQSELPSGFEINLFDNLFFRKEMD
ncbi:MAG TPA: helix-turn-helix domain-containing GNAT family N-acetyltransferase [Parachlamydiaceae bacterium]|nr:helix-turn-helix domain-containing GNAT family N-acetyltransferase [Parachlamydiaceae bacterium]